MRCPVCKAENVQAPACRRCKADLGLLFALEDQRDAAMAGARRELAAGQWRRAHALAARADCLRRDTKSLRLLAVAALLDRDFHRAWRCYLLLNRVKMAVRNSASP
jgi:hypothetical protein